ncbi:MAG: OmpH family outer membrane protein [Litoreibacter sp.]
MRLQSAALNGAVAVMLTAPCFAQTAPTSPVLTLDQERMYAQSMFGKRVQAELTARAEILSTQNRQIDATLTEEEQRLTDERPSMEPADFRALAIDFDERVTAIRLAQAEKQTAIQREGDAERARFFELAFPILLSLVEESGAVAILNDQAVIFSVRQIDITDRAIARIDQVVGAAIPDPEPGVLPVQRPPEQP